jgi:amidase
VVNFEAGMSDEFAHLDGTAQARLVRDGQVTAAELVEAAIARVEQLNPELNAVIHPLFDKARATASSPDLPDGPFRGVPFLVKDAVCHTQGDPYHFGMRFLKEREWVADADTELARRFRAAGFVFIGRTNTPELAMSATTEPLAYGPTRNPWSPEHSPGGSSGGSAAAVAAGLAPVGHANDMGGSIRIPASCCGLVGLKPTRARTTLAPDFGEYWGPLTHEHVVTRSVRDSAAVLDAVAGPAPGDPYGAPPPARPWSQEVGGQPGRLRIGFTTSTSQCQVDPACAQAVQRTAALLESLGHEVEEARPEALDQGQHLGLWIAVGLARDLDRWSKITGSPIGADDVEPLNWAMAEDGRAMTTVQYLEGIEAAQSWARDAQRWWDDGHDVLVTPTAPTPPCGLGALAPTVPLPELMSGLSDLTCFTGLFNVTGQPAISLPLHWTEDGLPVGVQLVGAYAREDLLIRLASQLEQACPWAGKRPPIHA